MPPSPAHRRDHRTAVAGTPLRRVWPVAACLTVAAAGACSAAPRVASDPLETEVRAAWEGVPIRDWARRVSAATGVPVIVDLRLDPGLRVSIASDGDSLRSVLDRVALAAGAVVESAGAAIRLVPRERAGRGPAVAAARHRDLARLPEELRRLAVQEAGWAWQAAARPRDLVGEALGGAGITIAGLDRIPHDHLPAESLPPLSLAERLDLLLASYDLRIAWSPAGAEIVAIDEGIEPSSLAAEPAPRPPQPAPVRPQPRREAAGETVYSLRLAAPLDQAVKAVAEGLGLASSLDEASLAARGIARGEIVRVEARDLSRDRLLDALVAPLGLSWTIEGGVLRVFAAADDPANPRGRPREGPSSTRAVLGR